MVFALDMAIPVFAGMSCALPAPAAALGTPVTALCGFARSPQAEEVARFVELTSDANAIAAQAPALRLPQFEGARGLSAEFAPLASPEHVAAFVQTSADASPAVSQPATAMPQFEDARLATPLMAGFAPVPRAEEVAAFVETRADAVPFAMQPPATLVPGFRVALLTEPATARFATLPRAEEAAAFVAFGTVSAIPTVAAVQSPGFEFAAVAEDAMRRAADFVDIVDASEEFFATPAAEPVWSMLTASSAGWVVAGHDLIAPALPEFNIAEAFMPASLLLARPGVAEATEVHVFALDTASALPAATALSLSGTEPILDITLETAPFVHAPAAQPVESMPAAQVFDLAFVAVASYASLANTLQPPACVLGDTPAAHNAEPAEVMVFTVSAVEPINGLQVIAPELIFAQSAERLDAAQESTPMPAPLVAAASMTPAALQPIRTIATATPEVKGDAHGTALPLPGFIPLEFYFHKPLASLARDIDWHVSEPSIFPPPFRLKTIFTSKPEEEAAPQKKISKKPAMAEVFELTPKKKRNPATMQAFKAVAASLLVGSVLWFGMGAMRIGSQTPAVNRDASSSESELASNADSSTAQSSPVQVTPVAKQPTGAMAKLKQAISRRAASTTTDSFRNGMEAWGTPAKAWAPGWSHHPEGYVQPGQLAIFRPSVQYTDYHLEFFGQIENKSMGWTVRAKDTKNYYAMKVAVVEPGLRPIVAVMHYPVVGGKKGKLSTTPLNVMVHNNKPFQVAVDVKGNRMITSIDGQEVDTWIDDTIPAGGVGFFADAGEKARLYWMKISKNEDFMGRVCAYISSKLGDGSTATAELWAPEPFGRPAPSQHGGVSDTEMTLRASFLVFPAFSRRRQRHSEESIRRGTWNS